MADEEKQEAQATETSTETPVVVVEPASPAPAEESSDEGKKPTEAEILLELERTRAALKERNKENASWRKKLEKYEQEEREREAAKLSEVEREKKRADEAEKRAAESEQRVRETLIRAAFVAEAAKVGAAHPEDVYRLADLSEVDVDDSGKVTGVAEAVKALVDAGRIPLLTTKTPAPSLDGGAGGRDRGKSQVTLTQVELDTARRMGITPERYAAQKMAITSES